MIAPGAVRDRIRALLAAGESLGARPLEEVLEVVEEACRRWLGPGPDREAGEEALAARYGVPRRSIAELLDAAFPTWTMESLRDWIATEIGDPAALDGFVPLGGTRRRAVGPRLALFLAARGVPTTQVADLISALSVKSSAWLRPPAGGDDLALRFARTVSEIDPGVGSALVVEGWERESGEGDVLFASADVLVATGGPETMAGMQRKISPQTRLILHGPRLSVAIVLREALEADPEAVIEALARDTAFAGQMGCLSPVAAYVQAPEEEMARLVEPLHAACVRCWPSAPRVQADLAERAAFAEWRTAAALGAGLRARAGDIDSAWSVVARAHAAPPAPPPVPRVLTLMPFQAADQPVHLLARRRGAIATVGLAGPVAGLCGPLAAAGVERVCPLGRMQRPPAAWRRDGRATLGDLVRWVDREG